MLGDIDDEDIFDMSGGWSQSFSLDEPQQVTLSFRFNLTQNSDYEADEFSEVLVMVDDSLISPGTNGSLARLTGTAMVDQTKQLVGYWLLWTWVS